MKISTEIQKKHKTPYQEVSEIMGVTVSYVTMIANGHRKPTKKKGIEVLKHLKEIANRKTVEYPKPNKTIRRYSHIEIAKLCDVSLHYVRSISCGKSKCTTEKSQQVLKALQELAQ